MGIRFKTDFNQFVVSANLKRRGWEEVTSVLDDDWDIYWANVATVKFIFGPDNGLRLQTGQLINHFPNHYELTRKDLLVKNIKRHQRSLKRDGGPAEDIIPSTFVLPQDYALFVEEYRKAPNTTWIMKPPSRSQGKGIFLINKLSQIKAWRSNLLPPAMRHSADSYVVSRYIDNPLLIGGKKFDLRLYVVVTSFKPLQVYMSKLGFARFCNLKYIPGAEEIDNEYVHLTNVAIQKNGDDYNEKHGNKWTLEDLRLHLEAIRGVETCEKLFSDIEDVVIKSLKACQNIIINDRHCFELYGFDIILDQELRPWLIEVNASPSLSTTTQSDRLLKFKVINDVLLLVTPPEWLPLTLDTSSTQAQGMSPGRSFVAPRASVGSLHLICDEEAEVERQVPSLSRSQRASSEVGATSCLAANGPWMPGGALRRSGSSVGHQSGQPGSCSGATLSRQGTSSLSSDPVGSARRRTMSAARARPGL